MPLDIGLAAATGIILSPPEEESSDLVVLEMDSMSYICLWYKGHIVLKIRFRKSLSEVEMESTSWICAHNQVHYRPQESIW
jgi:hypothetical protein